MADQSLDALQQTLLDFHQKHQEITKQDKLAIAVSGGPDSMALSAAMADFYPDQELHYLTVDHDLRSESKEEIKLVFDWVSSLKNNRSHVTLTWKNDKPEVAIQEKAREARYQLLTEYCQKNKISYLYVAHHLDDQTETFFYAIGKRKWFGWFNINVRSHDE